MPPPDSEQLAPDAPKDPDNPASEPSEEVLDPEYAEYLRELPEIIANMISTAQIEAMGTGCPDPERYFADDERGRFSVTAVVPRSSDPEDVLVIYKEKAHRPTVDWIMGLTKKKK